MALSVQSGKLMQNGTCKRFNWRFRDECLNEHWFSSLREALAITEAGWMTKITEDPTAPLAGFPGRRSAPMGFVLSPRDPSANSIEILFNLAGSP